MMPQNTSPKIELLQAEVDDATNAEAASSYFRILVENQTIKYLTISPGLYSEDDLCFGPALASLLPDLPADDWNDGLVARDPKTGKPHFAHARVTTYPGVKNTWHATYVEYLDLRVGRKLRTGVYEVECPRGSFPDDTSGSVVAKFARFEWEVQYLDDETRAYSWIDGHDIGPRFLGHITEHGRVIGFLMEGVSNAVHAGPQDLELCQQTLARLHDLGIRHGDVNRFNFLIQDNRAVLIDFDTAHRCDNQDALREESDRLAEYLGDSSQRGGGGLLPIA